jgi:hypothetical protein
MDYRSLNINDFNAMNQSVVLNPVAFDAGIADYEHYIRQGKIERAQMTLNGLRYIRKAVANLFA